ncbi:FAD:protein FMN transferase [Aquiflexum sp. LQ15W]|uniref:FAD:protein FMN transferase n=1 Tax=Cognataquiflexum nitidum TaxID=2922272 RepID=UPI001F1351FC|nr:FAD:protein FMN transferase [Cognataquiflexum nitidum]MCH6201705.1 FAD:protein FMN transferase [Cognataquiflexum nitidum]
MRTNANKNIIYSIILLLLVAVVYLYRQNQQKPEENIEEKVTGKVILSGNTMGTTYNITYLDPRERDFKASVDSLLVVFNQSLSTYIPDSELSKFNQKDTLFFGLPYFLPVLQSSKKVFEITGGAFDPTVGPLVNLWGFGPTGPQLKDSVNIDGMLDLVGFNKINFDSTSVRKSKQGIYLDFSAIAKGFGVDVVAEYLQGKGIENLLVEIGGELVARGVNEKGELWKVGINRPEELGRADALYSIVALDNKGMATSGNYRNYYEAGGIKISHTINPATGRPVNHSLLSATVLADDCMTADAYATAMMVMGTEQAIDLQKNQGLFEIFLIYSDSTGQLKSYASEGLKPFLSFPQD